jgi:tRNA threonylcarbamoyl adenosine modification protein YeaZ
VLVLVLDTSSAAVTAAVARVGEDVELVAERVTVNSRGHGELLAPAIDAVLREAGCTVGDLAAIVVGTGPGPFTGLRVGLVTAAVLADTLGIPAYGVCSLDGIAHFGESVFVATDARRREVYWARYIEGMRVEGPEVGRPAELDVSGPMVGAGARLYVDVLGGQLLGDSADRDYPSALQLARVAADRVRDATPGDALTPLYLRRPDAEAPNAPKSVTQ